jgi:cell division transport system ATP-binding protein
MSQKTLIELTNVAVYQPDDEFSKFSLDSAMQVLADVNLSIGRGEMVYFIGKVGSGKSSLLKLLYAELPLVEGKAKVVGFDLARLRRKEIPALRRKVGIVFQDCQLLRDRNVYENLRFVMRATGWKNENEILGRAEELLERVGLEGKMSKRPFELSGGEQQRLMIARALINEPDVIIADEPTGNLDPKSADDIMRLFVSIVEKGCSVVMATHNVQLIARYPARTYMFRKGHIAQVDSERLASL